MYIIIEGIDTAGKSTQLDILKKNHTDIIFTKEPGGTELGSKIREIVLNGEAKSKVAEMFLFLADRAEHSFEVIKKNKESIVISDRGLLSGIAYAQAPLEIAISLNIMALNGVMPDKVILLELNEDELKNRLSQKDNHDNIEQRGVQYLLEIQTRMVEAINMINDMSEKKIDLLKIDARKPIDEISIEIEQFLSKS